MLLSLFLLALISTSITTMNNYSYSKRRERMFPKRTMESLPAGLGAAGGRTCSVCKRAIWDHPSEWNTLQPSYNEDCPFRFVD